MKIDFKSLLFGLICGFIISFALFNRYESVTLPGGQKGRLNKLTGTTCILRNRNDKREADAAYSLWGIHPC